MKQNKWIFKETDNNLVKEIAEKLNISPACARVLAGRGIKSAEEAEKFINPELKNLHNPFLLPDMEKAVMRIRSVIDRKEKILVYGDSDVDGITSVSIVYNTIKSLGGEACWYIPSDEGYGLNKQVIEGYSAEGVRLIITVDCGISAFEEIDFAGKLGLDTIVCDHHQINESGIPAAFAVIDAKRKDSIYPFNEIAGCTTAFKLSEGLMHSFGKYFNVDLSFIEVENNTVSAVKSRNNIVINEMSETIVPGKEDDLFLKLDKFAENSKIAVYDLEKENEKLEKWYTIKKDTEFFSLKELSSKYFKDKADSLDELAGNLNIKNKTIENNRAFLKYEVFKNLEAIDDLRMKYFRESQLDLLALGTIADMVPLVDENRIIAKQGLKHLINSRKKGIKVMVEKCTKKSGEHISAKSVSWDITPVLNAAGRLGKANLSLELLLCDNESKAVKILDEILKLNAQRKSLQSENTERMLALIERQCDMENDPVIIVKDSNIEQGILGLIATQIVRKYNKPAFVILQKEGEAVGSCRCNPGLDIVSLLAGTKDLLIRYGGHAQAAGFSMLNENVEEFIDKTKEGAKRLLQDGFSVQEIKIDSVIKPEEISDALFNELLHMEPFGAGNPYPALCLKELKLAGVNTVGTLGSHLKLKLNDTKISGIEAVGWNMGYLAAELAKDSIIDMAFNLETNTWQDKKNLQLKIVDIKANK